ncbi:hypothetical protein [Pseudarthrobacter scleromae]|uniref:hypothetical protein n=1 Tax=Pseudarthrobacter scleromae TaxID=158897 RepID=UPI003CFEED86
MSRIKFELTVTDHGRAARLMLATVQGDRDAVARVLDEVTAEQERGAANALIFALADFGVREVVAMSGDEAVFDLEAHLLSLLDQATW